MDNEIDNSIQSRLKNMAVYLRQCNQAPMAAVADEGAQRIEELEDALFEMYQVVYNNPAMDELYEKVMGD